MSEDYDDLPEQLNYYRSIGLQAMATIQSSLYTPIPIGCVGIHAKGDEGISAQAQFFKAIGVRPNLSGHIDRKEKITICALSSDLSCEQLQEALGPDVSISPPGEDIPLPALDYFDLKSLRAKSLDELARIESVDPRWAVEAAVLSDPLPVVTDNPLEDYSVRGQGEALAAEAMAILPLLGFAVLLGQMTLIYGTPNVGKTLLILALLIQAIREGRFKGGNLYYINADDSSQGAAEKVRLLDAVGAHTLLPGHRGFEIGQFEPLLLRLVEEGKCKGVVIVVDTLKKLVDLMDKSASTRLGKAVRAFVQAGGTFIGLAHTNKNPGANGRLVYAGTADFFQDADAALYLLRVGETPQGDEVLVQFEVFKRRGPNRDETYAYLADPDVPYLDRLASVRLVDETELRETELHAAHQADADVIAAIREAIEDGNVKKMELERAVRSGLGVSRSRVHEVLDRYEDELWAVSVRERGAKVYRLLD